MNCNQHSNTPSVGGCKLCGAAVCAQCLTVIKGNVICTECMDHVRGNYEPEIARGWPADSEHVSSLHETTAKQDAKSNTVHHDRIEETADLLVPRSRFLTFVFSFLPGLGHLYLGLTRQGIELMVLFFGVIFLMAELHSGFPLAFVIPILFFYGIFDALQKRDRIEKRLPVDPQATFFKDVKLDWIHKKWIGWTVIVVGILVFFNKMDQYGLLGRTFRDTGDVLIALLLVGVGVWMIRRERGAMKMDSVKEEPPHA